MVNITQNRRWYLVISGTLSVLSVAILIISTVQLGQPLRLQDLSTSRETIRAAGLTVLATAIAVPLFVGWAHRRSVSGAFRYGACALVVLGHNVLITLGFYTLMGLLLGWEADILTVAAILAVIGLSVQDVAITAGRIEANVSRQRAESWTTTVDRSVAEILSPSLTTRLCVIVVLVIVTAFSGPAIQAFAATLIAGTLCETYANLFFGASLMTI